VDAALHRAASWGQLRKSLPCFKLPNDFWTAVEKGMQAYIADPKKAKDRVLPAAPFPVTINRERNTIKSAYHAQSKIGWENLLKGITTQGWTKFIETHYAGPQTQGSRLGTNIHRRPLETYAKGLEI
jgi:hypothetical protein